MPLLNGLFNFSAFMHDLDVELWKMGVTAKTKHNEVAPAQYELAVVYSTTNIATEVGLNVSNVRTNGRQQPRFFLIDPAWQIGNTTNAGQSTGPGIWDTDASSPFWVLGVATSLDGWPLINNGATMTVHFVVPDGGTFVLFASDYMGIEFVPGTTLTVTATFSDGTTTTATTTVPTLTMTYNGKLRDRVGQQTAALGADGALDGTLTASLRAWGGRTITALKLQSTGPGYWDTDASSLFWVLGVATALDGVPLINDPSTMAVNFAVPDGGSFVLFASDWAGIEFARGVTLSLTATFSDGATATAVTRVQ